jgi:hypothetical protein
LWSSSNVEASRQLSIRRSLDFTHPATGSVTTQFQSLWNFLDGQCVAFSIQQHRAGSLVWDAGRPHKHAEFNRFARVSKTLLRPRPTAALRGNLIIVCPRG